MNDDMKQAINFLKVGNVVAFPTETVYGLGANASDNDACQKIFRIKGRPSINPLIVHVASISEAESIGEFNEDAKKLASHFWPGPLSIVVPLKRSANIAASVLAGLNTVALRIPAHNIALELIRESRVPIAAPSANPSGYISATSFQHVQEHFANTEEVFILQDTSNSKYGIESTIVDSSSSDITVLRSGFITNEALEMILKKKINLIPSLMQIKAPGMMEKHYAPKTKVRLNASSLRPNEIGLNFANSKLLGNFSLNLSEAGDLLEAASNLYSALRTLDNYADKTGIAVATIPSIGIGVAINDRLTRAAKE
jgi:L-threonylcarbamoyladenylate synthase